MKTQRNTSRKLADRISSIINYNKPFTLLEPSVGEGIIIESVLNNIKSNDYKIVGIELNENKSNISKDKFSENKNIEIIRSDFINYNKNINYFDYILAMPPFKENIELNHIIKMYNHLKDGGILVSGIHNRVFTNNEDIQIKFRNWLSDKNYNFQLIEDNEFIEKGKSVHCSLLTIIK